MLLMAVWMLVVTLWLRLLVVHMLKATVRVGHGVADDVGMVIAGAVVGDQPFGVAVRFAAVCMYTRSTAGNRSVVHEPAVAVDFRFLQIIHCRFYIVNRFTDVSLYSLDIPVFVICTSDSW